MSPRFVTFAALLAASCAPPREAAELSAAPSIAPFVLPQPNVTIAADPPPPFTYWAPEGSTIRNHPNPGIWNAFVDGRNVATYFGDACRASAFQAYVGQKVQSLPPPPSGVDVRLSCESCAVNDDLRPNRMNVIHDSAETIVRIACY